MDSFWEDNNNTMFQPRTYRKHFNNERFQSFVVEYKETDLWIGVDPPSFNEKMKELALKKVIQLWKKFEAYFIEEPEFQKTLNPFKPGKSAPVEAVEMANSATKAGIGPMSAVAGLFAQEVGHEIIQNFYVNELVIENGGDFYLILKKDLLLSVYAGDSPLSEKIGVVVPYIQTPMGICTSAGTVGHSLNFGKADAVMVACKSTTLADSLATAIGNMVKSPGNVEEVLTISEQYYEILSLVIICEDKLGIRGNFEVKFLK